MRADQTVGAGPWPVAGEAWVFPSCERDRKDELGRRSWVVFWSKESRHRAQHSFTQVDRLVEQFQRAGYRVSVLPGEPT